MPTTEVLDGVLRIPGFCSCGTEMVANELTGNGLYCPNCDRLQSQEIVCDPCRANPSLPKDSHENPGKRVATDRDYAYMKVWRQRMLKLYPGQSLR